MVIGRLPEPLPTAPLARVLWILKRLLGYQRFPPYKN